MNRHIYTLCLYLATPFVWLRLFLRARKQAAYRQHIGERWGVYGARPDGRLIWVHAVSVGETRAAQPLITALAKRYPQHRILLTGMTPTGRDAGREVYGDQVIQAYLPYDYPGAISRFLTHFRPEFGVLMETEIWPNLLHQCRQRHIPLMLANARLSTRSARGYARFARLSRPAFAALAGVAAQTEADAERLRALAAPQVSVCGNLKFDVALPADKLATGKTWRSTAGSRPVWLAASTREGEEALIIDAWRQLARPEWLLVLVPRHPQRFNEVAALLDREKIPYIRRSDDFPDSSNAVWLGDSMGEMAAYYAFADLAFIGGSLLPLGGQNLIEAAAAGCPVLVGPHTFNFLQATADAISAGAARRVADPRELADQVEKLLVDRAALDKMREAARAFAAAHQGATGRTLALIERLAAPAGH